MELYQSLDPLLHHDAFIGRERSIHYEGWRIGTNCFLTSHAFGAIPHHPFFKLCLSYYDDRHFVLTSAKHLPATLKYDQTILPYILSEIARQFGYNPSALAGMRSAVGVTTTETDSPIHSPTKLNGDY